MLDETPRRLAQLVAARFQWRVLLQQRMHRNLAVERKLLHSIHGMWASNRDFDGEKFCAMSA